MDPLRHHRAHRSKPLMGDSFAERLSEKVASGMGSVPFIVISTVLILAWVFANGAATYITATVHNLEHGHEFDPEPWILLNLCFSAVAFFTGALVIIAQKAQAKRDHAREEADANHREELAQGHTDLLKQNTKLTEEIHAHTATLELLVKQHQQQTSQIGKLAVDVDRLCSSLPAKKDKP
jgi:uncharacterized membrane protein